MPDNLQPESLTPRERDILRGMVAGLTNAEIAQQLVLSTGTVKWYVKQLYGKLDAHSREEAIQRGLAEGLGTSASTASTTGESGCPVINPLPQDVSGRYVGNVERLALLIEWLNRPVRLISLYGRA